jgi:hypothetical protein
VSSSARSSFARLSAPVGLHLVTTPLWNERWRDHDTFKAEALDLSVQPVTGWSGLVAERQPLVLGRQLAHQLRRCCPCVLNLAKEPNLATPAGVRNFDVSIPTKASL